jgi:hypothetical protein
VHRSLFLKCGIAAFKILTLVALCLVNPGKLALMAARDIMANTSEPGQIRTSQSAYFRAVVALLPELVGILLLIFSVAPTIAATYAGPSAQAADLWTTQADSPVGRFLSWAKASGREVPKEAWLLSANTSNALRELVPDLHPTLRRPGIISAEDEALLCGRTVTSLPDFEALCRAQVGQLRWHRVVSVVPDEVIERIQWRTPDESIWLAGALAAANKRPFGHLAGRRAWFAEGGDAEATAPCSGTCLQILGVARILAALWYQDNRTRIDPLLSQAFNDTINASTNTRIRIQAVKASLVAAAYLGLAPADLAHELARRETDPVSQRRLGRAAELLHQRAPVLKLPLQPGDEEALAIEIGMTVLREDLPKAIPNASEDAVMAEHISQVARLKSEDSNEPEAHLINWLTKSGRHAPTTVFMPTQRLLEALRTVDHGCDAFTEVVGNRELRGACELHRLMEIAVKEDDDELRFSIRHRRSLDLLANLASLNYRGPFAEPSGIFLDQKFLKKTYRSPGGHVATQNISDFMGQIQISMGEVPGRLFVTAHEVAHELVRGNDWNRNVRQCMEEASGIPLPDLETRLAEDGGLFSEMFSDSLAVLTVSAYLGKPPSILAARLAESRRPRYLRAAKKHDAEHLTTPAIRRLALYLRTSKAARSPHEEEMLALRVASEALLGRTLSVRQESSQCTLRQGTGKR